MSDKHEPINEPLWIGPTFIDGLSAIVTMGSVTHLIFTARQRCEWDTVSKTERIVQARLVIPSCELQAIGRAILAGRIELQRAEDENGEPVPLH
jgi:hypothetical protein